MDEIKISEVKSEEKTSGLQFFEGRVQAGFPSPAQGEYADTIRSLRSQTKNDILDTDIARRFHDLSAQDAHPTAEEWQALRTEIDRQHPQLFPTLLQHYAGHQPDQTMTEQERHVVGLIVIRCSPLQMSVLMVCTKSNVSNLRRRLYHKLTGRDGSGTDLDKYVAALCE